MEILNPIRWLVLVLAVTGLSSAQTPAADEYQVKAAFLYNFAKFVVWPPDAFKSAADPVTICVLGNPFGDRLASMVGGKQVGERHLEFREIADVAEAAGCQILFVASPKKHAADLLDGVRSSPILTVGESQNFAAAGGIIGFKLESGKVRLQINVFAADRARLRISSKLLSLADIVKEDKK